MRLLPAEQNEVRNKQMFFGGLPLNPERPTMIKQLKNDEIATSKKFSTEAFLELYLLQKSRKVATF
jgi:hypothetical protein